MIRLTTARLCGGMSCRSCFNRAKRLFASTCTAKEQEKHMTQCCNRGLELIDFFFFLKITIKEAFCFWYCHGSNFSLETDFGEFKSMRSLSLAKRVTVKLAQPSQINIKSTWKHELRITKEAGNKETKGKSLTQYECVAAKQFYQTQARDIKVWH